MQSVNLENKKEIKNLTFEKLEEYILGKYNKQGLVVRFDEATDYGSVQHGTGEEEKYVAKKYQKGQPVKIIEKSSGGYASGYRDAYYGITIGQEDHVDIEQPEVQADIIVTENSICNGTDKQFGLLIPELGIDEYCSNATTQQLEEEEANAWEQDILQIIVGVRYFTNAWEKKK